MNNITILSNTSFVFSKQFYPNSTISYPNASLFQWGTERVEDIHSLTALLTRLEKDQHSFIVRGQVDAERTPPEWIRRKKCRYNDSDTYLTDAPLNWLMIDIDKLELPEGLSITDSTTEAIQYAVAQLPTEFHDVSYHWSLSSSAGVKTNNQISAHLFFWLDMPIENERIGEWAIAFNSAVGYKLIDPALFNAVQPHYLAPPVFHDGVSDPFEGKPRSGFIRCPQDSMSLDLSIVEVQRQSRIHRAGSWNHDKTNASGFENILRLLGDAEGCEGFNDVLLRATASYASTEGKDNTLESSDALKERLRQAVGEADQSKHYVEEIDRYLSDEYLDQLIQSAAVKFGDKNDIPPHFNQPQLTLEEGEKLLQDTIDEFGKKALAYLQDPLGEQQPVTVIKATAGLGKTTEIIKRLTKYSLLEKGDIHYFVPTHELSNDLEEHLDEELSLVIDSGSGVYKRSQVIYGRNAETCNKSPLAAELAKRGLAVSTTLCKSGNNKCEFYDTCGYQQQFSEVSHWDVPKEQRKLFTQVTVMTHPHLYLRTKDRLPHSPALVVIDESFFSTMLYKHDFSLDDLRDVGPIASFISYLLFKSQPYLLEKLREQGYTSEQLRLEAMQTLDPVKTGITPSMSATAQQRILKESKSSNTAGLILLALADELESADRKVSHAVTTIRDKNNNRRVAVYGRRALQLPYAPLLIIDADADRTILDKFLDDYEFIDIRVKRKATVFQATDQTFAKTKLLNDEHKLEQVNDFIGKIGAKGKTLVCSSKSVRQALTAEEGVLLPHSFQQGTVHFTHFANIRGLNYFKDFENVIIVGREQPPTQAIEEQARSLFWDDEKPLRLLTKPEENEPLNLDYVHRGIRISEQGKGKSVRVQTHPDPRIEVLMEQKREAESLQAIDRLRLLREHPDGLQRKVFILSNVPLDIEVYCTFSFEQLQTVLQMLVEGNGVLPLNPKMLFEHLDSLSSENTAKARIKWIKDLEPVLDNLIPSGVYRVKCRRDGQKKPSDLLVERSKSEREVEKALASNANLLINIQLF